MTSMQQAPQQTLNQKAIQLLLELKRPDSKKGLPPLIVSAISELKQPGRTIESSAALKKTIEYLITVDLLYSENIAVLESFLALGCPVPLVSISNFNFLVTVPLIEKLCFYSKNPQAFTRKNAALLLSLGNEHGYRLLTKYLAEQEIIEIIQGASIFSFREIFIAHGHESLPPEICHSTVRLVWQALLPKLLHALNTVETSLQHGITTPFSKAGDFHLKIALLESLIWFNRYADPETIQTLTAELTEQQRYLLALISLSIGLDTVSPGLAKTGISVHTSTNLFHQLLHLTRDVGHTFTRMENYTALSPLFKAFGLSGGLLDQLGAQRDLQGLLPLQVLLKECSNCASSDPFFFKDSSRFQSWFDFLLHHTPKHNLPECLSTLLNNREAKNFNFYMVLLKFLKAGCDLSQVASTIRRAPARSEKLGSFQPEDLCDNSETLQALLKHLQQFPETLSDPIKTEQMIQELALSPVFQAVTLLAMEPPARRGILKLWRGSPQRLTSLFLDRDFSMGLSYTGPWLPFLVIMQHDLPAISDFSAADQLEEYVQGYLKSVNEQSLPALPDRLLTHWQQADQLNMYGRSLHLAGEKKSPQDTKPGDIQSVRLKFRKNGLPPESWEDFAREQAVLTFLNTPDCPVKLESQLLKPGGIYQLPETRALLSQECNLPKQFQHSFEQSVYINPKGEAYVQVLEDSTDTGHYHHYPYLIDPALGLTRETAFEGIRLYCRDSGKLWRMGIKSPDAMNVYHSEENKKPWVPLPAYSVRRHSMFCTSHLCAWNRQIPDIAHAPVGVRDHQGTTGMHNLPTGIYGERRFDWSDPLDMKQGQLIELGKQFYGAILNWLRVRYDHNELDHLTPRHLATLSSELATLYADLFSSAFGGDADTWKDALVNVLPTEVLHQATRECLYWCSPQHRYVTDICTSRFPEEVYPEHHHRNLQLKYYGLTEEGYKSHPDAKGLDLGSSVMGNITLNHLAALFWFGVMEGVLSQDHGTAAAEAPASNES